MVANGCVYFLLICHILHLCTQAFVSYRQQCYESRADKNWSPDVFTRSSSDTRLLRDQRLPLASSYLYSSSPLSSLSANWVSPEKLFTTLGYFDDQYFSFVLSDSTEMLCTWCMCSRTLNEEKLKNGTCMKATGHAGNSQNVYCVRFVCYVISCRYHDAPSLPPSRYM